MNILRNVVQNSKSNIRYTAPKIQNVLKIFQLFWVTVSLRDYEEANLI